jgi:hypothetical protein
MMGRRKRGQEHLFYSSCLEEAVPDDHLVRAIAAHPGSMTSFYSSVWL